ncbi:MAG: NAD(P)-dependent oxidoreductase [Actinomycetota bacterium]
MRAVVFGGAGFLGSHVCDALSDAGHDVIVFDTRESPYLRPEQTAVVGDIMDEGLIDDVMTDCEVAYNFAGIADIDEAKARPVDTIRLNVLGNTLIAEAACRNAVRRFLFASSVYVYSQAGSFYRSSKQASEMVVESYQRVRGLEYTILRFGSLYGPRSDTRNGIYRVLHGAMVNRSIEYAGDGEEVREYIHVRDAARLSVEALGDEFANEVLVLTGHHPMKVRDLLRMVQEMVGDDTPVRYRGAVSGEHYDVTPYSFRPRVAKKVVANPYLDLGQGLLEILGEIHDSLARNVTRAY